MIRKLKTAEATLRLAPSVLATSRVTGLMELAAARLVHQGLQGEVSSVGIAMNVTHAAPMFAAGGISGGSVRAVASYRGITGDVTDGSAGRLHHVVIDAFDESGLIARAEHTRAIVIARRARKIALDG